MLIWMAATTPAQAFDCAELDPTTCRAALQVAEQVNEVVDRPVITDDAPVRLRPTTVHRTFEEIREMAEASGCEVSEHTGVGTVGGTFRIDALWRGVWSDLDGPGGEGVGWTRTRPDRFWGSLSGPDGVGDFRSAFTRSGRIVGRVDEGFAVGEWVRARGRVGVFVVLYGDCPGEDDEKHFASWLVR